MLLHSLDSALFANSQPFLKAYFINILFLNVSFLYWYIIMSTKENLCRHVVFSQNCCFVANFVDKALVDDSTNSVTDGQNANPLNWFFFFLFSNTAHARTCVLSPDCNAARSPWGSCQAWCLCGWSSWHEHIQFSRSSAMETSPDKKIFKRSMHVHVCQVCYLINV